MGNDTITFVLEGEVALEVFAQAIARFTKLIEGLSEEAGG